LAEYAKGGNNIYIILCGRNLMDRRNMEEQNVEGGGIFQKQGVV
jgi:hypothetical protein